MTALVAQIGARRHYAVPRELYRCGMLACLVTDLSAEAPPWRWIDSVLPQRARPAALRRLLSRRIPDIPAGRIKQFPLFGLVGLKGRRKGELQTDYWVRRNAKFCRAVVAHGFGAADTVYAYNGAALEIFHAARDQGLRTVLDQTAAPWRWNTKLLQDEAALWPGWEDEPAEIDVSGRLAAREEAEWALADQIVCGSQFAADTLAETGGPVDRCVVVPYPAGALTRAGGASTKRSAGRDGPLRVLFVGTLQLRKGIQYLLEAKRLLAAEPVTVRAVGPSQLSQSAMRALAQEMDVRGAVARGEIAAHYDWADVLVLPTLSEGAANVCYEAMAAGLPVITTANAGSILTDGRGGSIVPIRDAAGVAAAIKDMMSDEPRRRSLGVNAAATVARASPAAYSAALAAAVGGAGATHAHKSGAMHGANA